MVDKLEQRLVIEQDYIERLDSIAYMQYQSVKKEHFETARKISNEYDRVYQSFVKYYLSRFKKESDKIITQYIKLLME